MKTTIETFVMSVPFQVNAGTMNKGIGVQWELGMSLNLMCTMSHGTGYICLARLLTNHSAHQYIGDNFLKKSQTCEACLGFKNTYL